MNNHSQAIKDRVIKIVRDSLSGSFNTVFEENGQSFESLNLIEDLGMDSVQILSLLMTLEEQFEIELDEADVDLEKLMDVQAMIDFVVRKTAVHAP